MNRSSLSSTAAVAVVVVGVPALVANRLLAGLLPLQRLDLVLVMGVIVWAQICIAILNRDEALTSLTQQRLSLRWQADNLVAQSVLGVGFGRMPVAEPGLVHVHPPSNLIAALLPPEVPVAVDDVVESVRIVPSLSEPADASPEILATEEYVVARGDTFWSISEYVFGDGRHWKTVQELNIGRQVAPGVLLTESHEPRIGWSILIPLVASSDEADEANAAG